MILNEIAHTKRNESLDYLAEYLIESQVIDLQEAKKMIHLIEAEKKSILKSIRDKGVKELKKARKLKDKAIEYAKNNLSKDAFKSRKKLILYKWDQKKEAIKNAVAIETEKATGRADRLKGTVKGVYKQTLKKMPKKGKYGTAAAGLATAAGIAAYAAKRKRNKDLAAKKK